MIEDEGLVEVEGFRSLNQDIQTIINKSEAVEKAKAEGKALSKKDKQALTQEEKEYKSTGLNVKDFELLCLLGVFNASLMNDAIFKFKRYEDSSLSYTGIDKHAGKDVGGWDAVIRRKEYEQRFYNQLN